jgi:hypothetical protein
VSRLPFFAVHGLLLTVPLLAGLQNIGLWLFFLAVLASLLMGIHDMQQTQHSLRRNFPVLGRMRWGLETLRPFIQQYFLEADTDGAPISRMYRAIAYQRAKGELASVPFGTRLDTDEEGYEWMAHSIAARDIHDLDPDPRVLIGAQRCRLPYAASLLNISAMSFGRPVQQCDTRPQPRRAGRRFLSQHR